MDRDSSCCLAVCCAGSLKPEEELTEEAKLGPVPSDLELEFPRSGKKRSRRGRWGRERERDGGEGELSGRERAPKTLNPSFVILFNLWPSSPSLCFSHNECWPSPPSLFFSHKFSPFLALKRPKDITASLNLSRSHLRRPSNIPSESPLSNTPNTTKLHHYRSAPPDTVPHRQCPAKNHRYLKLYRISSCCLATTGSSTAN